ncbi:hypothetical protein [Paludisphaera mucosa]|uniref:Uncharacterized protein n=1 Tax=Paludisphaera mucosa TaxID=3030827 RepID=A0ABT6FLL9_9BACT|nr:hypothetical protein [Paludisphaera mucosa]MDG3008447.1 hypothetical protein [Paludisphaera mucosa]
MVEQNTVPGIKLADNLGAALGGSPEDAAKTFMRLVTQGMAQVMADAVAGAITQAVGGNLGASTPDWVKLVKGPTFEFFWETPGDTPLRKTVAIARSGEGVGGPALGGIDIRTGGCGGF